VYVPLDSQLIVKVIQQKRHAVPSHLAAFVVKVKVMVFDIWVIHSLNSILEGNTHRSFVARLVDKVDYKLRSIETFLDLKVFAE